MRKIIIIIILVTLLTYANSFFNKFIGDDNFTIVKNGFIKSFKNFPMFFSRNYLSSAEANLFDSYRGKNYGSGELTYRPLVTLSYMLDYLFWKLNPFGYHFTNVLIHVVNTLLLFFIVLLLLRDRFAAFLASIIFGVHPINSAAVNHISYREDLLLVLFFLLAFIFFIQYRRAGAGKNKFFYYGSCLFFFLALLSKETAIIFPAVIILYDAYFESDFAWSDILRKVRSRYLGYFLVALFYLVVYFGVFPPFVKMSLPYAGGTFITHVMSSLRIIARYMVEFFIPVNIHAVPALYAPVALSIFDRNVIASILLLSLTVIACVRIYRYSKIASFAIAWYFITILPVSNLLFPLVNMFSFRYAYLPCIGFCVALGMSLSRLCRLSFFTRFLPILNRALVVMCIICIYVPITIAQNVNWRNGFTFGSHQVTHYPDIASSYLSLIAYYYDQGFYEEAIKYSKKYIRLSPNDSLAYKDMGLCYIELKRYDKAEAVLRKAIELRPDFIVAYYNLGYVYLGKNDYNKAADCFRRVIGLDHNFAKAHNNLGVALANMGKYEEAKMSFENSLKLSPHSESAQSNLLSITGLLSEKGQ